MDADSGQVEARYNRKWKEKKNGKSSISETTDVNSRPKLNSPRDIVKKRFNSWENYENYVSVDREAQSTLLWKRIEFHDIGCTCKCFLKIAHCTRRSNMPRLLLLASLYLNKNKNSLNHRKEKHQFFSTFYRLLHSEK